MKDLVGRTLGHYRIEAALGFGGMGQVFRGKHVYLERLAAVKVMHEHLASHPTFRARFLQEAKAAEALKNPHIVEIYEFGEQDGLLYLVMELLTDGTLSTLLQPVPGRRFDPGARLLVGLDLIRQAAEGLDAAHALGMIHRDIKPDNLLLRRLSGSDQTNEQYQLKISDFGLARVSESSGLTTGGPVGTPTYMSPEQCLNQILDGRSDLYSLGVVLYEVLTGRLPFQINTFNDAVKKHVNDVPPPLRQIRPDLPPFVEQIVGRCLTKRREERYQTGKELAEALQGAINHAALETRAPLAPPVANPAPLQIPPRPLQVHAIPAADRTTLQQAQDTAPTKKRRIPNWFFPGLAALLAVALILAIVIPLVATPSSTTPKPTVTISPTATPVTGLNAFLAQARVGTPVFNDSLTQGNSNWDQNPGVCVFTSGSYEVTSPDSGTTYQSCYVKAALPFSDFTYEVQMTILQGDGGGMVFRDDGAGHNYLFLVNSNGTYQIQASGSSQAPLSGQSTTIIKGVNNTNTLDAVVMGNTVDLYINKQFVNSFNAQESATGQIGLSAFRLSNTSIVEFKNVKVWRLS